MSRILLVEDDEPIREELSELLKNAGYETACITDFASPLDEIMSASADLILLREIRRTEDIPVIMVTSRTNELDEVLSMSYGADDYITKPYNPTILLLRISAVLKRSRGNNVQTSYRGLTVDTARGSLSGERGELILTKNEMLIFRTLLERQGKIVSRDELMTVLWDNAEYINDNALTVNISRLRTKLSDFGCDNAIETRKKQGYILI